MITEDDMQERVARDIHLLNELDFQIRDNHKLTLEVVRLEDENAKLREELEQWHKLTAGIELPEYPITLFQPKDLERENAKLRQLLSESLMDYKLYAEKYGLPPYISDVNEHLDARLRELGVDREEDDG